MRDTNRIKGCWLNSPFPPLQTGRAAIAELLCEYPDVDRVVMRQWSMLFSGSIGCVGYARDGRRVVAKHFGIKERHAVEFVEGIKSLVSVTLEGWGYVMHVGGTTMWRIRTSAEQWRWDHKQKETERTS